MKHTLYAVCIMLVLVAGAFADIARPDPPKTPKPPKQSKSIDTDMYIRLDSDAKDARLIIPKSQIKQLRAQLDDMDDAGTTAAVVGSSRIPTIMSGGFISLALIFGGIWFVRSGKAASRYTKGAVAALFVLGVASAASYVYANAGPPPSVRTINGKMFSMDMHYYNTGWGKIKLETTDENDRVTLIVPNPPDKPSGEE